mmetsp:Transcript_28140/g.29333  ORF Transcript_28140/g.29333 Transcript_28140/m.29333 type:complete len:278 (+) Transcript_28140:1-834(+)
MKHRKILFLVFILLVLSHIITSSKYSSCQEAVDKIDDDEELVNEMKHDISPFISNHESCIDLLLNTGNYNSGEFLMDHLLRNKIKFRDGLKKTVSKIEVTMKELYNKYRFDEEDFQVVSPVIQWAQSMNQVFIHLKFSHRHDSPGCPEVKNLNVDLVPHQLYLTAYCIQADIPIKFELNLPFFVEIAPEDSKHNQESNGRYIFSMAKSQTGMFWDRLVRDPSDYPKHTKTWLEMHEKYKSEIEKYIEDDEEEEYKKIMEDINKKKKKGRKKKVKFDK